MVRFHVYLQVDEKYGHSKGRLVKTGMLRWFFVEKRKIFDFKKGKQTCKKNFSGHSLPYS
jgi:hypothetical protein